MFRTDDPSRLRQQLDRFTIPMFVAELSSNHTEFVVLAINKAHEDNSGLSMADVTNRPLSTILPVEEAANANSRYAKCLQGPDPLRYREQLQMPKGSMIWDTSLCRLELPDGRMRVIGTALVVQRIKRNDLDTLAFQDVNYFASTSSMRLTQISDVLAAVEDGQLTAEKLAGSAGMLAALCRSVSETLEELRSIAAKRLAHEHAPVSLISLDGETFTQSHCEVDTAVRALITIAEDVPSRDSFTQTAVTDIFTDEIRQRREG